MDKINKAIKNFISEEDDEEYVEEEEEVQPTSTYEEANQKSLLKSDAAMMIFEPRSYDEATTIADFLKARKACVVNIHKLQNDYRQRLIDFLWGAVYAIDGQIQKVGTDVFLCTPRTMTVDGQVNQNDE